MGGHLPILKKTETSSVVDSDPAFQVNPVPDTDTEGPYPVSDPGFC